MGRTSKNIHATISMLRTRFPQGSYDLLTKNCNIFSDALCKELVGRNIPSWINRLARTGNKIDSGKPTNTTASKQAKPSEAPPLSKERNTLTKKQKAMLERMRSKKKKKKNRV
jgi:deubiquitinase DESI2